MILWLWRGFVRYVIGYVPRPPTAPVCEFRQSCGQPISPICVEGHCRRHCSNYCTCEKKLTPDEVDLLKRYRDGRLLEEHRS